MTVANRIYTKNEREENIREEARKEAIKAEHCYKYSRYEFSDNSLLIIAGGFTTYFNTRQEFEQYLHINLDK